MNVTEVFLYFLLYGYILFGLFYYMRKATAVYRSERLYRVSSIGIAEKTQENIDFLFEDIVITRLD